MADLDQIKAQNPIARVATAAQAEEGKSLTPMILAALDLAARVYHENLVTLGDDLESPLRYLYERGLAFPATRTWLSRSYQLLQGDCPWNTNRQGGTLVRPRMQRD